MSNCVSFHAQLASIMEVLANAAVAEICKLVDDGYAVLRLEMSESRKENKALKRKLQSMELRIGRDAFVNTRPARTKVCSTLRQTARGEGHFSAADNLFCKQLGAGLTRDGEADVTSLHEDDAPAHDVMTWDECADMEEDRTESLPVKEEGREEDSDPLNGHTFSGQRVVDPAADGGKRSPTADAQTRPAKRTEGLTEQHRTRHGVWEVSGPDSALKSEPENDSVSKSLQHRGFEHRPGGLNSLGSELVMFERNGQLGTYFSQEDGETEADDPTGLYRTEAESARTEPQPRTSPLPSLDWKADVVVIDPAPVKEEAETRPTWNGEASSGKVRPALGRFGGRGEREGAPTETVTDPRPVGTHSLRAGSREKRFFCAFCGRGFSCPKKVEIHQRVHTGEKPFSCAQCRKQFAQAGNLKRHQRVHTGEKPFSCTQCEKRFSHLHQVKMHQKVHTGERPHACPHCGKRFAERSYLRIHQQRNHSAVHGMR